MHGRDFDELARSLAHSTTRRSILRKALAGAVAAVLGSAGGEGLAATCRPLGGICRKNGDCCTGTCGPADATGRRKCACPPGTEPCSGSCAVSSDYQTDPRNCGSCGHVCPSTTCSVATCNAGVCGLQPNAAMLGKPCDDADPCTVGTVCLANGTCGGEPVVCQALDQCHDPGVCNPQTGMCTNPFKADGSPCDDGNACTQTDTCQSGVCVGGNPIVCTASDQCHDPGTCNPMTGECSNPDKPNGSPCDDGNLCTQIDTCQAGICVGGNPVVCTALDQCHAPGVCDPQTGACSNPPVQDSTPCSDGSLCTDPDVCVAGVCMPGSPKTCPPPDQCHTAGICNPATGECEYLPKPDGSACDDGNACTQTDTCQGGVCVGGNPVVCTALDQCHVAGVCDPASGVCSNPAKQDGSACNDNNACTQTDTCQAGVCVGSNPITCTAQDQCHVAGVCDPATGMCSNPQKSNGSPCSDNNACTDTDTCQNGVCTPGTSVVCEPPDQCHEAGICNQSTGQCEYVPKSNGTPCDDGNTCTATSTCQSGVCTAVSSIECPAPTQCQESGICNPTSGTCDYQPKPNGTACDDGNACTLTDTCQAGVCVGGNPVTCTAQDQCHDAGVCNPSTGVCSNPAKANGSSCNDGNLCTVNDTCQGGTCTAGSAVVCTAQDQCHDAGTCDPATGVCSNPSKPNGSTCNDGNACTQTDTCQNGVCTGSNPVVCTAIDQCHNAGTCNPATGLCSTPNKANGTACNDNNACTQTDTCQNGVCTGGNPVICSALDQCHDAGTCNPATGMCSNPDKPFGSACTDFNACTVNDFCSGGTCVPGTAVACTALDECHVAGVCSGGVCSNPNAPNGTACAGGTCCNGHCCASGNVCCGSGANFGCCPSGLGCCGGVCCNFANSKCCGGLCYVGVTPPC